MSLVFTLLRFVLTGLLIYLSYTETGIYTALCFALIFIAIEIIGFILSRIKVKSTEAMVNTMVNAIKTVNRLNTIQGKKGGDDSAKS